MEKHLIIIELVLFLFAIVLGILAHLFHDSIVNVSLLNKLLEWTEGSNLDDLLDIVDRYALIVGGISFFVEEWTNEDTENKVFLLLMVLSLMVARFLQIINLQYISLTITCINVFVVSIPFLCFIYKNIINSHRRDLRKG